jgi:hypothetical protein
MELNISQSSWHFRVYSWWKEFGGFSKPSWFKENLCHYMRVVLIWAPLGWFLRKPIFGNLRPWIVTAFLTAILATLVGLRYFMAATIAFWVFFGAIWLFVGAMWLLVSILDRKNKVALVILATVTSFIWVPVLGVAWVILSIWGYVIEPLYFRRHKYTGAVWLASIAAIPVLIYLKWGTGMILVTLFILVAAVVCVAAIILLLFVISEIVPALVKWGYKLWMNRKQSSIVRIRPARPGISTAQLFNAYRRTKWGSVICPFIKLPHQWE